MKRALKFPLWLVVLLGCAGGRFEGNVYRNSQVAFQVAPLDPVWQQAHGADGDVVFHHPGGGAILTNAACDVGDVPLDVLLNQSLFGVQDKKEQARESLTIAGREALRARLTGTMDGVPVAMDLVLLKKDGCVYDLQLVAGAATFAARDQDFEKFVQGFQVLPEAR
jgi:hypothetical protein